MLARYAFKAGRLCCPVCFARSGQSSSLPAGEEHAFAAMELQNAFLASLWLTSLPLLFVGWILGETNPGADIHRGSGDFLLVRPVSRGSLMWTG